jgi:hypothetical protein
VEVEEEEEPDSDENADEEVPAEEKKEKNYDDYETDKTITPYCFIRIDAETVVLTHRVQLLPQV